MRIVKKLLDPSRPDAERLRRNEKTAMLHLMYAVTILEEMQDDIPDRIGMVQDGAERLKLLNAEANALLDDIRLTIPENQRIGLQNTAEDYVIRLTPNHAPSENNVLMTKEEFREMVDLARSKCRECVDDDEECTGCRLYKLLTSVLPLDDYHYMNLCPYNLGEWKN